MGVAMLKICQNLFYNLYFFLSAFLSFCGCRFLRAARGGVASLKICQKSFLKSLFLFIGECFFLRLQLLRAAREGGRFAQNLSKSFLKSLFHFFTANVSNCANCLRGAIAGLMGRMQQAALLRLGVASLKILQNLFLKSSYYVYLIRRMPLLRAAEGRREGCHLL